jgi:exodeoxyribonuclease V alpha subunit
MTTHLSARLTWHENAWNGEICSDPPSNAACMFHEHERSARNDKIEEAYRGQLLTVLRAKEAEYLSDGRDNRRALDESR